MSGIISPIGGASSGQALSTIVYRSRAVRALGPSALRELTLAAQSRNNREAVTGLMLYDQDRFFQWLEGPPECVDRIMTSIRNDTRHTDIEVLNAQSATRRMFDGWSMKLAAQVPTQWRGDVIDPPQDVVAQLHLRPEIAPSLLIRLVAVSVDMRQPHLSGEASPAALRKNTAAILKSVFLSTVIPALADGHGIVVQPDETWPASNRVRELVDLLIAPDQTAAVELIREMRDINAPAMPIYATLFEPAARRLGDLWSEDFCSEFDVTMALSRLQTAARLVSTGRCSEMPWRPNSAVLVVPEPGELHQLGAALDSDVLRNAGWSPHSEFPTSDQALQDLVSGVWFDALDLSLSSAFRRDNRLSQLTETIVSARRASLNPALVVIVGGRVFVEDKAAGGMVGADLASKTSTDIGRLLSKILPTPKLGPHGTNFSSQALTAYSASIMAP
ncbi:BLUF domain-containing protein [Acidisphaera sp. L21]|uniref:BLUF domain-containing protein n=1 Tax=Acidisphaera sp. L21 TaxID=1641851 RepID=UPI00131E0D6D|nr:BLUF domain-containing protein [Acidisphaera sp. L21]